MVLNPNTEKVEGTLNNTHEAGIFDESYAEKKPTPLRLGKKVYEFYTAPITKFWMYTVSNLI